MLKPTWVGQPWRRRGDNANAPFRIMGFGRELSAPAELAGVVVVPIPGPFAQLVWPALPVLHADA